MRHIRSVQLVNSYRTRRANGLLLRLVAHTDLKRLLVRYRENEFDTIRDCNNREWIRPVLRTLSGVEAKAWHSLMSAISGTRTTSGRSVKIHSDYFGQMLDLHMTSMRLKTARRKNNKGGSKRYAAPEIIALRIETSYNQCAELKADSNRVIEEGAEMIVNTPIGSDFKEARDNRHKGRPISLLADVDFRSFSHVLPRETAMDKKGSGEPRGIPLPLKDNKFLDRNPAIQRAHDGTTAEDLPR